MALEPSKVHLTFNLPGVCELLQPLPACFHPGGDG